MRTFFHKYNRLYICENSEKLTVFNVDFFLSKIYFDGILLNSTEAEEVEQWVS